MKCPKCQNMDTKVVDSRVIEDGQTIRRRRECEFCQHRFSTFERRGYTELTVIKKDGTKELYDKQKLKQALLLAYAKRAFEKESIETMISNLEIKRISEWSEITSKKIGEDVLAVLKEVDPIAYVRFASVYRSFDGLEDFKKIISNN